MAPFIGIPESGSTKQGIWSSVSKRAKAAFSEDGVSHWLHQQDLEKQQQHQHQHQQKQSRFPGRGSPSLQMRFEALASSLTQLGGSLGNAIEEGLTIVETKASSLLDRHSSANVHSNSVFSAGDKDVEQQLRDSRDRLEQELQLAQERCLKVEEENRKLKELIAKDVRREEDDWMRMQLEALLVEKSRLGQENANFARENKLLRELVKYHQLSISESKSHCLDIF